MKSLKECGINLTEAAIIEYLASLLGEKLANGSYEKILEMNKCAVKALPELIEFLTDLSGEKLFKVHLETYEDLLRIDSHVFALRLVEFLPTGTLYYTEVGDLGNLIRKMESDDRGREMFLHRKNLIRNTFKLERDGCCNVEDFQ